MELLKRRRPLRPRGRADHDPGKKSGTFSWMATGSGRTPAHLNLQGKHGLDEKYWAVSRQFASPQECERSSSCGNPRLPERSVVSPNRRFALEHQELDRS